jgi:hypothetical protein
MTLEPDALSRLEDALPTLRDAVEREHLGKALNATLEACRDLPQRIDRLEALGSSIGLLSGYAGPRSDEIAAAVEQIEDLGELMSSAETIDDLDEITRNAKRLEQPLASLHRSTLAIAAGYSKDQIVPLAALERLLRTLNRGDIADAIARLRVMDAALPSAGTALPARLADLFDARAGLTADLTGLANGSEVDAFLTAFATRGTAPLEVVTPGVLDWLSERGALKEFVVQALT